MRRRARVAAAAAGLAVAGLLATMGEAPAGPPPRPDFIRVDLEVGGNVSEVVAADLQGDGRKDLLVIRGREALVYFQGSDGSWATRPNQRFRFHPRAILFDVGDLDGDGRVEVTLLQREGVAVYRLRQAANGRWLYGLRPEDVVEAPAFLARPVDDEIRRKRLVQDLDGDGRADLLLPRRDGFTVLRNASEGAWPPRFEAPRVLAAPPKAILNPGRDQLSSRLFASYWFPNPRKASWDGSESDELVVAREGTLTVFGSDGEGLPLTRRGAWTVPDQKRFSLNVENPFELDFTMPLVLRDLDGDGRVDVSSTHVGQGITRVFRNKGTPSEDLKSPSTSIRAKGVTLVSFYADLDGDGIEDLILPRIDPLGVWSVLEVLVTRSVSVEALIYYGRPGDGALYPDEPDLVRTFEVPVAIQSKGDGGRLGLGSTIVANLGDFDGDGRQDMLYRTGASTLSFFRGLSGRRIEEEAGLTAEIPDVDPYRFCLAQVHELTGDARDDVVLLYKSWDRESDAITVLLADGEGN